MRRELDSSHNSILRDPPNSAEDALATRGWVRSWTQLVSRAFLYIWKRLPVFLRAFTYRSLATLGLSLYRNTGSCQTHRLPFNLYLRMGPRDWASKHQAELQSLRMIEAYTRIPASRGLDAIEHSGSSYLLMTGVPGQGIGRMLYTMTDQQMDIARQDLEKYLTELRQIPNNIGSDTRICNSLGRGVFDWRITDSQREELVFHNETEFNQCLTSDLLLDEEARIQISKSHSVNHRTIFTHADLNLRNILVDENKRISGIVDWECAGWYPEYWECAKMHFAVRVTSRRIADVIDQIFPIYYDKVQAEDILSSLKPLW
jgi:aminoglycoside phosphotransferase